MKLTDRMKIARECEVTAKAHGASVEILPRGIGGDERETLVTIKWPELCASFAIDGDGDGIVVSFYGAARPLRADYLGFDSVNSCHRRKATTCHDDGANRVFVRWLAAVSADITSGEVFA